MQPLFQLYDGMVQHHSVFLRDLEHRIVLWEGRSNAAAANNATYANTNGNGSGGGKTEQRVGDLMLKNMVLLPIYEEYLDTHRDILQALNDMYTSDHAFQQVYREFEQQKTCYVPIFNLLLKPFQRLVHYKMLLDQLVEHYPDNNFDRTDCQGALMMLERTVAQMEAPLTETNNFIVLCELQRDLMGIDNLVEKNRQLIRQGCLLKHSKRGLQQRMFFLVRSGHWSIGNALLTHSVLLLPLLSVLRRADLCQQVADQSHFQGARSHRGAVFVDRERGAQCVRHFRRAEVDHGQRGHDGREESVAG